MTIFSVYVINKAGGLVYQRVRGSEKDGSAAPAVKPGVEKTLSYPLEFTLKVFDEKIVVAFGERDGIKIGHTIMAINGIPAEGRKLADGRDIMEVLADPDNFPISIKFGRPELTTNERIMLASMFHSLFAIGSQLSPEQRSSGIEVLETDTFKLHCYQTMTGIKFVVMTDPRQAAVDILLRKMYEVYSDFALKCPFYSLDMPIRHELFESSIKAAIEHTEKIGMSAV